MAIPTWTWTERTRETISDTDGSGRELESTATLSQAVDEFDLLANPIRLEILLALSDRDGPVRYTALRAATSIDDNGKLNYHLRRLEAYVSSDGDGYELTPRGRRLLDRLP